MRCPCGTDARRNDQEIIAAYAANLCRLGRRSNHTVKPCLLSKLCAAQHCVGNRPRVSKPCPVLGIHACEHSNADQPGTGNTHFVCRTMQRLTCRLHHTQPARRVDI